MCKHDLFSFSEYFSTTDEVNTNEFVRFYNYRNVSILRISSPPKNHCKTANAKH